MDGVSAAASILAIGTAGAQISIKLFNLAKQFSTASERINAVSVEINFTSSVLKELAALMDQKSSEDVTGIFSDSSLQITATSAKICYRVIEELRRMLESVSKQASNDGMRLVQEDTKLSRVEKVKWLFQRPQMDTLRDELGKAKDSLMFVLQLTTLGYARKVARLNKPAVLSVNEQQDLKEVILTLWNERRTFREPKGRTSVSDPATVEDDHVIDKSEVDPRNTSNEKIERDITSINSIKTDQTSSENPVSHIDATATNKITTNTLHSRTSPKDNVLEEEIIHKSHSRRSLSNSVRSRGKSKSWDRVPGLLGEGNRSISESNASGDLRSRNGFWPKTVALDMTYGLEYRFRKVRVAFSWRSPKGQRRSPPKSDVVNREEGQLEVYFQKPYIRDIPDGISITWPILFQEAVAHDDILNEVTRDQRRGRSSLLEQLAKLSLEEGQTITAWLHGKLRAAELVCVQKTATEITHHGLIIRDVPCIRIIVRTKPRQQERPAQKRSVDLSRPTYMKVHQKHLSPETLDVYQLRWEWDDRDPNYIIILQWIPEPDQDILFEHTRKLREIQQGKTTTTVELGREHEKGSHRQRKGRLDTEAEIRAEIQALRMEKTALMLVRRGKAENYTFEEPLDDGGSIAEATTSQPPSDIEAELDEDAPSESANSVWGVAAKSEDDVVDELLAKYTTLFDTASPEAHTSYGQP